MYTAEELRIHPFFERLLKDAPVESVLDMQTGLVSRANSINFARDMVEQGTPFALAVIDIDRFKSVNDAYGQQFGDKVLAQIAEDLKRFVGADGVVGHLSSDKYIVAYLKSTEYDDVHDFFRTMYQSGRVFRRSVRFGGADAFITATSACVSFPKDAGSCEELVERIDKLLYRGKFKGRNCYIIYVKEKHSSLEIPALMNRSINEMMQEAMAYFDNASDVESKLRRAFTPLHENLHIDRLLCLSESGELSDAVTGEKAAQIDDLHHLPEESPRALLDMSALMGKCRPLRSALKDMGISSAMITRIAGNDPRYVCLIFCPEPDTERIWQDQDLTSAIFLARMLSQYLDK